MGKKEKYEFVIVVELEEEMTTEEKNFLIMKLWGETSKIFRKNRVVSVFEKVSKRS